jgi:PKHD-type hydroxylase
MMPKSKNNRKGKKRVGDRRPVPRSGNNEGQVDYRTAKPINQGPDRQCKYLDRVATLPNLFTEEECSEIINTALNEWTERESMIQRDKESEIAENFVEDFDYRNTTLFLPDHENLKTNKDNWIMERIIGAIMTFNESEQGYGFDVHGMAEPPNMMRYQAADINKHGKPGKYDWHMDVGPGPIPSMRKISYSVLLNAGEYEGGELAFHIGRSMDPHPGQNDKKALGHMLLFPSYMTHCVTPMVKGTRYAIVGWTHGNSFR